MKSCSFEFGECLINSKTKKAYNWYELRYMLHNDTELNLNSLIYDKSKSYILYSIMCEYLNWYPSGKEDKSDRDVLETIADNIITDDSVIFVPLYGSDTTQAFVFKTYILALIDLTNLYSKNRKRNIEIVRKYTS